MAFKPNDQCYGHIHGIVCDNVPILCTHVHLGMANNVVQGSFQLYCTKKSFSIFWAPKRGLFMKHLPRICCKMVPPHFCKILDQIVSTIHQLVASQKLSSHLSWKRQFFADSVGSGPNLNYRCFIGCSWFFLKIIFTYKSSHLIRHPLRV